MTSIEEGLSVADAIGYPVLVRPSYVLGGRAMEIVHDPEELIQYVTNATVEFDANNPIQVDKYLEGIEIEGDAVSDGENVLIPGVMEHIERAGVHSGDSMAIYPAVTLTAEEEKMVVDHTVELGRAFGIKGLMNIQFVIMQNETEDGKTTPPTVYVLEVNVRSSRTIPFISKITGVPMVKIASKITLGKTLESMGYTSGLVAKKNLVAVKAPVSSMAKLSGADTYLGPEMKSTGEVMGVDTSVPRALFKALQAANLMMPVTGNVLVTVSDRDKEEAAEITQKLITGGYKVYATEGTAAALEAMNIPIEGVPTKYSEEGSNNTVDLIKDGTIQAVVNTMSGQRTPLSDGFEIRRAATESGIPCYTSLDTFRVAADAVTDTQSRADYNIRPLSEYVAGIE